MAITTESAGKAPAILKSTLKDKTLIYDAIRRLSDWLDKNEYRGYDTFDGLNSTLLRPLTLETRVLRMALQQGIRRFPINLRPLVGIQKSHSTKGMGFIARGFIRLYEATGDSVWRDKAIFALQWLIDNQSRGYTGSCWANHFDYQSRVSYVPKGLPSVVWTSLIGHAFLDAYQCLKNEVFLGVAVSACDHILHDLSTYAEGDSLCISYFPTQNIQVHNANTLAGSLLARTYSLAGNDAYRVLAEKAIRYTTSHQRKDSSWYYGEASYLHWVDNFHTAYVLDSLKYYAEGAGDHQFDINLRTGYDYWKTTFFLEDGTPKYYASKTLPLDIQCCSQAIDTLVFFRDLDTGATNLALKVAHWTIRNMQDQTGYFYYRRYVARLVNKTPTLHWGQATMLSALTALYKIL
jgi:polysaccharide biosynthesis protein VpsJ